MTQIQARVAGQIVEELIKGGLDVQYFTAANPTVKGRQNSLMVRHSGDDHYLYYWSEDKQTYVKEAFKSIAEAMAEE